MSTRDKGQKQNRPTRIKILQFFNNRTTSQLTAPYKCRRRKDNGEIRNFARIQIQEFLGATKFVVWYILLPAIIKPVTQLLNGRYVHLR